MKKLITLLSAFVAFGLLAPVAQAGNCHRRVVGYNQCGDAVYATWRVVSYQRCGAPNYAWVRDRCHTGCTRPGRCNYHGHSHSHSSHASSRTVYRSGNSRLSVGFVTPRVTIRSSNCYRRSTPSRSYRSSSYRSSSSRYRSSCR